MNIYERIKKLCALKKIDVQDLEAELGYTRGHLYKWSNSFPRIDKLLPIANYFDVSLDSLVGRKIEPPDASITDEYVDLIDLYSRLNDTDKETVIRMLKSLAGK